jgi:hypothetical protein
MISLIFQSLEERGQHCGGGRFVVVKERDVTRLGPFSHAHDPVQFPLRRHRVPVARPEIGAEHNHAARRRVGSLHRPHVRAQRRVRRAGQGTAARPKQQTIINNARISMRVRQIEFSGGVGCNLRSSPAFDRRVRMT